jgi:hypothetical protein
LHIRLPPFLIIIGIGGDGSGTIGITICVPGLFVSIGCIGGSIGGILLFSLLFVLLLLIGNELLITIVGITHGVIGLVVIVGTGKLEIFKLVVKVLNKELVFGFVYSCDCVEYDFVLFVQYPLHI